MNDQQSKNKKKVLITTAAVLVILISIAGIILVNRQRTQIDMEQTIPFLSMKDISENEWYRLMQKKTFFAHMSVGINILSGAERKKDEISSLSYPIQELKSTAQLDSPGLYHRPLGFNGDPLAKINSFKGMMLSLKSSPPDLAFMKFCYVDIQDDTNIEKFFTEYRQMIQQVRDELPETRFLHCTVPLKSSPLTLKDSLKEMIRPLIGKQTNAARNQKRHQFNLMLFDAFEESSIFDIAKFESTTLEGHPCLNRGKIPMLCSGYTPDGGHLNETGQDHLGEQMLIFLAKNANP